MSEQPVLSVQGLAVSFHGRGPDGKPRVTQAVADASMNLYPRQTLAVVGESGSGKSVTALSALQLIPTPPGRIDRGRILFRDDGREQDLLRLNPAEIRRVRGGRIGMIFQEPMTSLNPVYSVGEQIVEAVRLHRECTAAEARQAAVEAMNDVGIINSSERFDAYPHQFSGGMRQRVMIAMTLACRPAVLLADEPTTALDVTVQAQILRLLRTLQQERGLAIMLITHALGVVAQNADVVAVMYAGRVMEYASVTDLFARPTHPYTKGLLASIPHVRDRSARLTTIRELTQDPSQFAPTAGGLIPWWPDQPPPPEVVVDLQTGLTSCLREINDRHWIACWRTATAIERPERAPDLVSRRVQAAESIGVSPE